MQLATKPAAPFEYSMGWIIAAAVVLIVSIGVAVGLWWWQKRSQRPVAPMPVVAPPRPSLPELKAKYLRELKRLQAESTGWPPRAAYQALSWLVRSFIHEATGVAVTKHTLQEIDVQKFPSLKQLMQEFYRPEFAAEGAERAGKASDGDDANNTSAATVAGAFKRVQQEIESWK